MNGGTKGGRQGLGKERKDLEKNKREIGPGGTHI